MWYQVGFLLTLPSIISRTKVAVLILVAVIIAVIRN